MKNFCILLLLFLTSCAQAPVEPVITPSPAAKQQEVANPVEPKIPMESEEQIKAKVNVEAEAEALPVYISARSYTGKRAARPPLPPQTPLQTIGEIEPVFFDGFDMSFSARIDTGATTSSINAVDQTFFERDGKEWVRFHLLNSITGEKQEIERPVYRFIRVKRHGEESQRRAVVKLKITMGDKTLLREFSLTDRNEFNYPVLIGRNVLNGYFVVDVSQKNLSSAMQE